MSDNPDEHRQTPEPPAASPPQPPEAQSRPTRFSLIWLIPIVVLAIGAYLAWQTISRQGPSITIEFDSADGLTSGQTQVKHKAVALGTVQGIELSHDLKHVDVQLQMSSQSAPLLTSHAKFWVVRPRLSGASITGLETLVSGAFIAIDPGTPGGTPETRFTGLDAPPGVRSDEPGSTYMLSTHSLGSIAQGSPVFFRDVMVGEVLGYRMPADGKGPIPVQVFVQAPYDQFLRRDTRFWNVSGVSINFSGGTLHFQIESLQALVSGGVAFGLPTERRDIEAPKPDPKQVFDLYADKEAADNAAYHERFHLVTYMQSSVSGLDVGSPVVMLGLQVGTVSAIKLMLDRATGEAKVRVEMEVQPQRVLPEPEHDMALPMLKPEIQMMVDKGMRAELDTSSYVTGASLISLTFLPKTKPVPVLVEGDALVIPNEAGGLSGIMNGLSTVSDKLAALPIEQIGDNLDNLLAHADATVGSPELKQSLVELNRTLASLNQLTSNANQNLTPVLQRLPAIADNLQQAVGNANRALASYGGNSDFHNSVQQTLGQLSETARSIRSLVDYLNRHPSSLIFGRSHP